jgi:hypothetical protein
MSEEKQIQLFDGEDITEASCKALEYKQGVYSGELLKANDPERYALVVNLLASGRFTWRDIRQATGVSMGLIGGVLKLQSRDIEAVKREQAAESRVIAGMTNAMMIEWLRETLDNPDRIRKMTPTDFQKLATAGAIATDKALVQTGQATSITEFKSIDPSEDEFSQALRSARRVDMINVEAVETGNSGESFGTKGGSVPGAAAGDPDGVEQVGGSASGGAK